MAGENRFKSKTKAKEFDPTELLKAGKQLVAEEEPVKEVKQAEPQKKESEVKQAEPQKKEPEVTQEKPQETVQKVKVEETPKAEKKAPKKEEKPAAPAKKKQTETESAPQLIDLKALEAKKKAKPAKKPTASFTLDPEVHEELKRRSAEAGFPSVSSYLELILKAVFQMED